MNLANAYDNCPGFSISAECYMDTVSVIRGNAGRGPLPMNERIYFMKKELQHSAIANPKAPVVADIAMPKAGRSFEFVLEATEAGEQLIDTYVGVDFSVIYKITATYKSKTSKTGVETKELQLIVNCPGSGIDPNMNRRAVPHDFVISHENLETSAGGKIPKFKFEGKIFSVNCAFTDPFDGYVIKRFSENSIKSLEIQLVRVETF